MKGRDYFLYALCFSGFIISLSACETVKPYQRMYVNDREMSMGKLGARKYEENIQAYREGATGGGGNKTSGGCGCN